MIYIFRGLAVKSFFLRILSAIIGICMCGGSCYLTGMVKNVGFEVSSEQEKSRIALVCKENDRESGEIIVELVFSGQSGLCGFLGELRFDENELLFLSGGDGDSGLNLSFLDLGGCVRFLLDGVKNSPSECVLARFYFMRTGEGNGTISLFGACGEDALYFNEENRPIYMKTELLGCDIGLAENNKMPEGSSPCFLDLAVSSGGEESVISFEVCADKRFFAMGAKIYIVEFDGAESHEAYVVGVTKGGMFSGEYRFSPQGNYAVIITATAFDRDGEKRGEKFVKVCGTDT